MDSSTNTKIIIARYFCKLYRLCNCWNFSSEYKFISICISGSGMDWNLSPISRLLTVAYLLVGVPIMFMYLKTTGSLAARAIRLIARQIVTCHKKRLFGASGRAESNKSCVNVRFPKNIAKSKE